MERENRNMATEKGKKESQEEITGFHIKPKGTA